MCLEGARRHTCRPKLLAMVAGECFLSPTAPSAFKLACSHSHVFLALAAVHKPSTPV
jgi:hypothetical protein